MERNIFSATFFVSRSKVRRNGLSPIMMTICCNGNRASFVTGKQVAVTEWDAKRQRVRGTSEHSQLINKHLQLLRNKLSSKENELLGRGYIITAELLKDAMTDKIESLQSKTLLQLFAQFLADRRRDMECGKIAKDTYRNNERAEQLIRE